MQDGLRSQRLGDILLMKHVVGPEQLLEAIEPESVSHVSVTTNRSPEWAPDLEA